MRLPLAFLLAWLLGSLLLTACGEGLRDAVNDLQASVPTLHPTADDTHSETGETGWRETEPGLEWRRMRAQSNSGPGDMLLVVRVDPSRLRLRVAYDVTAPGTVGEWATALDPLLVINGGYFDRQGRATALVINDGSVHGSSYAGFGGMFAVNIDGSVSIRSLRDQPYSPSEKLAQALQSTPMLLLPDGSIPEIEDNGDRARRTVVAQDRQGRLLFIVSTRPVFALRDLAHWLRDSELDLETALNLDGGSSTGVFLQTGEDPLLFDSIVRVPLVIMVERP